MRRTGWQNHVPLILDSGLNKQAFTVILRISNVPHFCRCHTPYAHFVNTTGKAPTYLVLYFLSISGSEQLPLFSWSPPTSAAPCYQGVQRNYTAPIKSVHQAAMGTALWFFLHMAIRVAGWVILFLHTELDILAHTLVDTVFAELVYVQFNFIHDEFLICTPTLALWKSRGIRSRSCTRELRRLLRGKFSLHKSLRSRASPHVCILYLHRHMSKLINTILIWSCSLLPVQQSTCKISPRLVFN